ncbi:MAG: HAD family phosphatase [Bacteroidaceae bacterium]|nr:HAD family phosphatase [Bacteroidaceae bacterium]
MKPNTIQAVFFDFDGVVMNTEPQYTSFWQEVGRDYFPDSPNWAVEIKGQTLVQIFDLYFKDQTEVQQSIVEKLKSFELQMTFDYVPGFLSFIVDLHKYHIKTAVVTSSNDAKMAHVYRMHPQFKSMFDVIVTADQIEQSKPDPACYLSAADKVHVSPENSVVFEDSHHGITAGKAAGAQVIGLATTHPASDLEKFVNPIIRDFVAFSYPKMIELLG